MSDPRVVLFDLDGVLTRRDTFETLVVRRLRTSRWRLAAAVPALPLLTLTARHPEWRGRVSRHLVRLALRGLSLDQARDLAIATGAEFARTPAWLNQELVERARGHLAEGDRVLVVTATEEHLARTLLDAVGLADVELVASGLARVAGGVGLRPHAYGRGKLRALRDRGVPLPWAVLYTDSLADEPVMRHVEEVVLIDPSPSLVRRTRRRLRIPPTTLSGGRSAAGLPRSAPLR
jgi:phosphatidylglycerophosphatase C